MTIISIKLFDENPDGLWQIVPLPHSADARDMRFTWHENRKVAFIVFFLEIIRYIG